MDGKFLARIGAAVFVGLAIAMTLVEFREDATAGPAAATGMQMPDADALPGQIRACAAMGEQALSAPDCRAAWAEKRRRFLGVDYSDAYSGLDDPAQPPAAELLMPRATAKGGGD